MKPDQKRFTQPPCTAPPFLPSTSFIYSSACQLLAKYIQSGIVSEMGRDGWQMKAGSRNVWMLQQILAKEVWNVVWDQFECMIKKKACGACKSCGIYIEINYRNCALLLLNCKMEWYDEWQTGMQSVSVSKMNCQRERKREFQIKEDQREHRGVTVFLLLVLYSQ